MLLVLELAELLLKFSQNSWEGKRRRTEGEKRCFPCTVLAHLWRCCSLGGVIRTKLIQLYLRYPGGTSSSRSSLLGAKLLNCLILLFLLRAPVLSHLPGAPQLVSDPKCFLLGSNLVSSTGCGYKLQEGGVEGS